jgi:hypothetical protein
MDNLDKFYSKFDVGIFLGYSSSSKAYRVYNKKNILSWRIHACRLWGNLKWKNWWDLDDVNKSVQHLNLNYKTPIEDNNE